MKQTNKQTNKQAQATNPQGFEAILKSSGKFTRYSEEDDTREFLTIRKSEVSKKSDRERVMTGATDKLEIEVNKIAFRIMRNLKHFHECGRLWEKTGEDGKRIPASISISIPKKSKKLVSIQDWSETGKVKPLSENDMDEIFLAARSSLLGEYEKQKEGSATPSLRDAWKAAAKEARRELYLVTKEQTFASRTRAESYSSKAREHAWEHYSDLVDMQGFSVADTLTEYFSEDHDMKDLTEKAKRALATRYQAKSVYQPSKMLRSSTLKAIHLLNDFVLLVNSKQFVLPKRKATQKKTALQQSLERLAKKIREGKDLQTAWNKGIETMRFANRKKVAIKKAQLIELNTLAPTCKASYRKRGTSFIGIPLMEKVTKIISRKATYHGKQATENELVALKELFSK